ncbi:prephenate/arogenate dehydrogenase family protein [Marinibaculum pumilum]|uniref:Prephenate/arogenate dehydrogenase family protein n=1 Tax=Marinibaculum pumilum TaxID=1766165 RepID=A0ABV7L667_9PROT
MSGGGTAAAAPAVRRLALIGVGLIGSSLARAARARGAAEVIAGYDANPQHLARAAELGLLDEVAGSAAAVAEGADLVILCTPLGSYAAIGAEIAPRLRPGTVVSDVGSSKACVLRDLGAVLPDGVALVPAHPVAGTEQSGPDAGFAELFVNRWCILTPPEDAAPEPVALVERFWALLGSTVERMDPQHHDLVLAITSHVPHLIAYNIVATADDLESVTKSEVIKYSAGGFRDFTRIAASDPVMWRDVCLNNREAVLEMLARFTEDLTALQRAIRWGEGDRLLELFTRTRAIRRQIIDAGQETAAPDFGRR